MLEYLRIKNLALISDMELEFSQGLNALTGETGAGKSFILKAINFLMGEKLDTSMVRPGCDRAQVEGVFYLKNEGELLLRRELIAETGRSRFFINDNLSSQETVRELRSNLILHTSQHGQQKLLAASYQLKLIDDFMNEPELLALRDENVGALRQKDAEFKALNAKVLNLQDKREVLEMHQELIDKVDPEVGEEEKLEQARVEIKDFEQSRKYYDKSLDILRDSDSAGLFSLVRELESALVSLNNLDDNYNESYEATVQFRVVLQELEQSLRKDSKAKPDFEFDSDEIESRLYELAQLKRKLNRSFEEILNLRDEVNENLTFLDICNLDIIRINKESDEIKEKLKVIIEDLNSKRKIAANEFAKALEKELVLLGFSERVQVIIDFSESEIFADCIELKPKFLWAPNPGQAPQALDKIASGGELSRFLLAVVSLGRLSDDATLIFDEVDAGVGGITLNRVAERLSDLASKRQMLLITHWAQLAKRAKTHFMVQKEIVGDETFTRCTKLNERAIEEELARMSGFEK